MMDCLAGKIAPTYRCIEGEIGILNVKMHTYLAKAKHEIYRSLRHHLYRELESSLIDR